MIHCIYVYIYLFILSAKDSSWLVLYGDIRFETHCTYIDIATWLNCSFGIARKQPLYIRAKDVCFFPFCTEVGELFTGVRGKVVPMAEKGENKSGRSGDCFW
jgi:hypothetical protein